MDNLPIPISSIEFKDNVNIRFNDILSGFNKFENFTLDGNISKNGDEHLINYISKVFQYNNNECYIDFFINRLDESSRENLMNMLVDKEDKMLLKKIIDMNHVDIYYKIKDINLIPFFTRLNTKELFFVTFYFTKNPITIWGNYNLKFPCFIDDSYSFNYYYDLAKSFNLINE